VDTVIAGRLEIKAVESKSLANQHPKKLRPGFESGSPSTLNRVDRAMKRYHADFWL
jgi:hypothetical protein